MKRLIGFLIIIFVLAGCAKDKPAEAKNGIGMEKQTQTASYLEGYIENPQLPDDSGLLEVDQAIEDSKGKSTLIKMKQLDESYQIGDMEITLRDAKWIHLRPSYRMIDYFHGLTGNESKFNYVKVFVEITNASEETLQFSPVALVETNDGEKISWENELYLESLNEPIESGESRKGNVGFIVDETKDLSELTILTSDIFDEADNKLTDAEEITVEF
ncbi:DUF4352 domain-containing protein [Oceanobacillus neutriphilus]|uniref:DUF4352 domain-containing protein n=1 Tax=Oceanobacillus neutriphilus TaxID=531815 RepID=A0ABQ2NN24_9BACI|nr:DUF4352 domain-containing protein [Oceanobacillus neutriphilus]GGP07481.1 hypothetical protein GCM10011346_03640 [Oceanobacillus neutriphilus]